MGSSHLLKIGKYFYFRVRIPKHLTHQFTKAELKKSLRTENVKIARKRAELLYEYMRTLFKQLENGMLNAQQVDSLATEYVNILMDKQEKGLAVQGLGDVPWTAQDATNMQRNYAASIFQLQRCLVTNDLSYANDFISWLKNEKQQEPEDEVEEAVLKRECIKKCIAGFKFCIERLEGIYDNGFDNVSLQKIDDTPVATKNSLFEQAANLIQTKESSELPGNATPIGQLLDDFFDEKSRSVKWRPNTITERKGQIELFKEYFGEDKAIESLTRKEIVEFRDNILQHLPKNRKKNKKTRNLSLAQQVVLNNVDTIHEKTINEYLQTFHMFIDWCVKQDLLQVNFATQIYMKDSRKPNTKRQPYTKLELEKIIKGLASLSKKGKQAQKNQDVIWICLLGLFQGMRENEICQLSIDNVVRVNNIPCLKATVEEDGNQSIKNSSSFRTIPIHQTILDLGFLEFVNNRRNERDKTKRARKATVKEKKKQEQLFITMSYSRSSGKYTRNLQNFYCKFNKAITSHTKRTFHSLRHNFSTCLNHTSQMPFAVSYLDGHEFKTETDKTYTHEDMTILAQELSRLDYGIDTLSAFEKKPLSPELIKEQTANLPLDDSVFCYE